MGAPPQNRSRRTRRCALASVVLRQLELRYGRGSISCTRPGHAEHRTENAFDSPPYQSARQRTVHHGTAALRIAALRTTALAQDAAGRTAHQILAGRHRYPETSHTEPRGNTVHRLHTRICEKA